MNATLGRIKSFKMLNALNEIGLKSYPFQRNAMTDCEADSRSGWLRKDVQLNNGVLCLETVGS